MFGNKWDLVKCFICGLGRLDLHHIIRIQFCVVVISSYTICNMYMSLNYSELSDIDAIVFKFNSDIFNDIYEHFRAVCT